MAYRAGTAFVAVTPSFRNFQRNMAAYTKTIRPVKVPVEYQAPKVPPVLPPSNPHKVPVELDEGSFATGVRKRLEAALKSLPKAEIGVAATEAEQKIIDLRGQLLALSDKRIGVDITDAEALSEIRRLRRELNRLGAESTSVQVRADVVAAATELEAVQTTVDRLDRAQPTVTVTANTRTAMTQLSALEGRLDRLARGRFLINVAIAAAPLAVPALAAGAGAAGGLGAVAGAGLAGVGGFAALAAAQLKTIKEVEKEAEKLRGEGKQKAAEAMLATLSAKQTAAANSLDRLSGAWTEFLRVGGGKSVLVPMASGMTALRKSLPALGMFIRPLSRSLGVMFDLFGDATRTKGFREFARTLGTFAAGTLARGAGMVMNLARGFGALFEAFMPLGTDMSEGLLQLSKRFADWSATVGRSQGFKAFIAYVRETGPALMSTLGSIFSALVSVGKALAPMAAGMLRGVKVFADWVARTAEAHPWLIRILGGVVLLTAGVSALARPLGAVVGVFRLLFGGIATGVKVLKIVIFNLRVLFMVMRASPIGMIITAVGLLVAGLVLAYKKSDTFRRIVDRAWAGIKKAVSAAWNGVIRPALRAMWRFITDTLMPILRRLWNSVVKPVFAAIGRAIRFAWNNVIKPLFKAWWWYISNVLFPVIRFLWNRVVRPVFRAIGAAIRFAWNNVIKPVFRALWAFLRDVVFPVIRFLWNRVVRPVFRFIGSAIKVAWNNVIKPVFRALWAFLKNVVFPVIRFLWNNVVRPIFKLIGAGIRTWWNGVVKPVFNALKAFFNNVLFPVIRFLWNRVVKPVFRGIGNTISTVWNKGIKPVFKAIGGFIRDTLVPAFRRGINKIGDIWDSLKRLAAVPVNFVIQTIYNRGIRKFINKVLDFFDPGKNDGPRLPPVQKVNWGGKAKGGVLPGYTPGRDVYNFVDPRNGISLGLSGGEPIMRPEFGRAVGHDTINRWNSAARSGGVDGVRRELAMHGPPRREGFFLGGVMPTRAARISRHSFAEYSWARWAGDINGPGDDRGQPVRAWKPGVVSAVNHWNDSYGNHIRINHPAANQESLYAHLMATAVQGGQKVRAGQRIGRLGDSGNSTGPHLHFEYKGGQGPISYKGPGIGWGAGGRLLPGWLTGIPGKIGDLLGKIKDFASGGFGSIVKDGAEMLIDKAKAYVLDKIRSSFSSSVAGDFGPGMWGIWQSLMSTNFYSKKQAAGVMGNMSIESGFDPTIVQGGGHKALPTGVTSGWGLVQWTPGTKVLPYLNGDGSIGSQVGALTAQLRGKGPSPEGEAGRRLRAANSVAGATYAFGKYYERPADLGSTIAQRRATAASIFERFSQGKLGGLNRTGARPDRGPSSSGVTPATVSDNGGWLHPMGVTVNRSRKPEPVFSNAQWQILKKAITALTLNQGRPISTAWLRDTIDSVAKSAARLREEFIAARDAMHGFRTRTERARRRLVRIRATDRYQRRAEVAREAERAFEATRSGEEIGEDIAQTRRDRRRALRRALRSPMGRDALREYRQAERDLEKQRDIEVVEAAERRTKWRRQEARERLRNERAGIIQARDELKRAQEQAEKADTKAERQRARQRVAEARRAVQRARQQPDSARERQARQEIKRTTERLEALGRERAEIEKLTKQRDRAGRQSEAVRDLAAATKRIEQLREERRERQRLRREARRAGRADILAREEKAQERLNKRIEAEKRARDLANRAAKAYRAAQEAAIERARTLRTTGIELGGIGAATSKTSGGIVSNLRRAVRTVGDWGQIVKALIGAGLRGPILEEFINEGPSVDAVRTGKSLLAGGQIGEINLLQDQLRLASTRAASIASAAYTPAQVRAIRRTTPVKYQPADAQNKMREDHWHIHGMPSDTAEMLAQRAADKVIYTLNREGVT